jgi:hypothetical protein
MNAPLRDTAPDQVAAALDGWPTAVKLSFIGNDEKNRARLVEARSLDDGQIMAILGFRHMAHWLDVGRYSYIAGTNGVWARLS